MRNILKVLPLITITTATIAPITPAIADITLPVLPPPFKDLGPAEAWTPPAPCKKPTILKLAKGVAFARIYTSPNKSSKVLDTFYNGDKICITGKGKNFTKINLGKQSGYIIN
jgi:hypothetical protein